jgi:hypothetical protein
MGLRYESISHVWTWSLVFTLRTGTGTCVYWMGMIDGDLPQGAAAAE